jgi:tripartite ATP-independent transporter DctM subunit
MTAVSATLLAALVLLIGSGLWIWASLYSVGIIGLFLFRDLPIGKLLSQVTFKIVTTPELMALTLFVLMAEILFRSRLSESLFKGLSPWAVLLPGRLLHVTVLGCTMFAAVSGSSAATTAVVGRISALELIKRGYDRNMVIGSLAGAGTFGLLIPPSGIMIIYGVLAEESILKLFTAGIIPGLLLALSYVVYIAIRAIINPSIVPPDREPRMSWGDRFRALSDIAPVIVLILFVMGSMYGGFATPTEAAAVGCLGALGISAWQRTLSLQSFLQSCFAAARTMSMIGLIIAGAVFLSVALGFLGVPRAVAEAIAGLNLSPIALIGILLVFYIALGMVLEGNSAIIMTLPITLPLALAAGFDKIWFGVFLVLVVEMAQVTPPVGFNLFVINSLTGDGISRIARAALPFFWLMVAMTGVIVVWPQIVLFLPELLQP